MKTSVLASLLICFFSLVSFSQDIVPAPDDKAVVYFVRPSSFGFAINFSYLDSTMLIGKFNAPKYIRYECSPGKHLFWARSENRYFIEAELLAGKIYFIEAIPLMGTLKAGVELKPIDPRNVKKMAKVMKLLHKKPSESFSKSELEIETAHLRDAIERGMKKYKDEKAAGLNFVKLHKSMFYGN